MKIRKQNFAVLAALAAVIAQAPAQAGEQDAASQEPAKRSSYVCENGMNLTVSWYRIKGQGLAAVTFKTAESGRETASTLLLPEGMRADGVRYASEFAALHFAHGEAYFQVEDNPFTASVPRTLCNEASPSQ